MTDEEKRQYYSNHLTNKNKETNPDGRTFIAVNQDVLASSKGMLSQGMFTTTISKFGDLRPNSQNQNDDLSPDQFNFFTNKKPDPSSNDISSISLTVKPKMTFEKRPITTIEPIREEKHDIKRLSGDGFSSKINDAPAPSEITVHDAISNFKEKMAI